MEANKLFMTYHHPPEPEAIAFEKHDSILHCLCLLTTSTLCCVVKPRFKPKLAPEVPSKRERVHKALCRTKGNYDGWGGMPPLLPV